METLKDFTQEQLQDMQWQEADRYKRLTNSEYRAVMENYDAQSLKERQAEKDEAARKFALTRAAGEPIAPPAPTITPEQIEARKKAFELLKKEEKTSADIKEIGDLAFKTKDRPSLFDLTFNAQCFWAIGKLHKDIVKLQASTADLEAKLAAFESNTSRGIVQ